MNSKSSSFLSTSSLYFLHPQTSLNYGLCSALVPAQVLPEAGISLILGGLEVKMDVLLGLLKVT